MSGMFIREELKDVTFIGEDLPSVIRWMEATPRKWQQASSREYHESSWDLGAGWQGALKLAQDGWPEGMRMVEAAAAEILPNARTSTLRYDVAGEFPDVARFAAGDPFNMISHRRQKDNHPVVHLIVNVCCSGSISAKQFAAYGGAVTALVDQIENTKRRVELDVVAINSHQGKGRSRMGWKVKRASDGLDIGAIAFSLAHPAAFRRLIFGMWERTPRSFEDYGYGTVADITPDDAAAMEANPDAILLDGVGKSGNGVTTQEMNKRLRANVEKALGFQILVDQAA